MDDDYDYDTYKLWKTRKNALQYCSDNDYVVPQNDLHQSLGQFKVQFGDRPRENPSREDMMVFVVHKIGDPTDKMIVFFPEKPDIDRNTIQTYWSRMKQESIYKAIIVVKADMTTLAKQFLSCMAPKYNVQLFREIDLLSYHDRPVMIAEPVGITPEEKQELVNAIQRDGENDAEEKSPSQELQDENGSAPVADGSVDGTVVGSSETPDLPLANENIV